MDPLNVFLLLLHVQVVRVSSFATQQHPQDSAGITSVYGGRTNLVSHNPLTTPSPWRLQQRRHRFTLNAEPTTNKSEEKNNDEEKARRKASTYNLGVGKNLPFGSSGIDNGDEIDPNELQWNVPETPNSKPLEKSQSNSTSKKQSYSAKDGSSEPKRVRKMVARTDQAGQLRNAMWHEEHYSKKTGPPPATTTNTTAPGGYNSRQSSDEAEGPFRRPELFYPNIDLSIPPSVYDPETSRDVVWDLMRWEAYQEAQREPLLVSFLYSSILNHDSLESSLAFLLANKLSSAAMISTQVQSLILGALDKDPSIGRAIRADIMAVRDRDPACTCLPDVFLYFKGFHALQTYRVANAIWKTDNKQVLAHYLQSQMSQTFQIDIHPNATLGSGIMLDHGTGIVIGETAHLGHNCSILHHVTLGGSGKKGVDRHPKVGDGVLLGAGASVLGNVKIGDGCQVGAGGLVITDLPPHSVAVGVPVKIIGSFVDVTEQPSVEMNQMMNQTFLSDGI
ncbi:unnamed protein product [Pseudo-nitzschia multistriata]|uniref:serine O-acetyltransferase n=1 Tax=Pseudo-nitzschia multistriata TaxID=183589 RepID=A0A448Z2J7_9STRA|nr:unnamed protein product [Pseudo-nitzschia multistriata]